MRTEQLSWEVSTWLTPALSQQLQRSVFYAQASSQNSFEEKEIGIWNWIFKSGFLYINKAFSCYAEAPKSSQKLPSSFAKSSVGVTASKLEKGKICLTKKDSQKECGVLSDRIGQTDCTVKCNCSPDRDQSELQKRFLSSLRKSPMPTMGLVRICSAHRALITLVSQVGL